MAMSNSRKHLVNRLTALIKNLKLAEENSNVDRHVSEFVRRIEAMVKSRNEIDAYRRARADRREAAEAKLAEESAATIEAELANQSEEEKLEAIDEQAQIDQAEEEAELNVGVS